MEKEKVLVVDDDENILEFLQEALSMSDYKVSVCSNATEALGKLKREYCPVIVLDIMMPGINGLELLKILKKEYPEIIVIMLTGYVSTDSAIKSLNEGAFAYLTKPINIQETIAIIQKAYEKYNLIKKVKLLTEEFRQVKETSETINQSVVHTVVATDEGGYIKKINKVMENLLGYKEEELFGFPLEVIFSKEFQKNFLGEFTKQDRVNDFPISFLTKDGTEIKLSFTGTIMKNASGQVIGFLGRCNR